MSPRLSINIDLTSGVNASLVLSFYDYCDAKREKVRVNGFAYF
jgi:hypothetical protein